MIKVLLFGVLANLAGTSEVFLPPGRVMDVMMELSSLYGRAFSDALFGEDTEMRPVILVNHAPVRYGVLEKELTEGDTVSLMPLRKGDTP